AGDREAIVPVRALATGGRGMVPGVGLLLAGLGIFLTVGLLTIIGAAVRESVLSPGDEPDEARRRRARIGVAVAAVLAVLILWGGNTWWAAEAADYGRVVLFCPFWSETPIRTNSPAGGSRPLALAVPAPRRSGGPDSP